MATQITNRAQLTFQYGTLTGSVFSNVASTTLQGPLTIEKTSVGDEYTGQGYLTYVLSFTNTTNEPFNNISVSDNLGSYSISCCNDLVTPLDYVGPAALYVNGVFVSYLQGQVGENCVTFNFGTLGSGDNAIIIYKTRVNEYAPLSPQSTITNTAVVTADGITEYNAASNTVTIGSYADVSIVKTMTPDPVQYGDTITYNFTLYNYGNTAATNVVLTDSISHAPVINSVSVNGTAVARANYSYVGGTLTLPTGANTLTIPAATFTRNASGVVTKVPGVVTVTVVGTI